MTSTVLIASDHCDEILVVLCERFPRERFVLATRPEDIGAAVLASVVPPLTDTIVRGLEKLLGIQPLVVRPLGLAEPLSVADVDVTMVWAAVVATGASRVVNDITLPNAVPSALVVIAQ